MVESDEDLAAMFDVDGFAVWARYRAGGLGNGRAVLVIEDSSDQTQILLGRSITTESRNFLIRTADAPNLAKGDTLALISDDIERQVIGAPARDELRHVTAFGVTP